MFKDISVNENTGRITVIRNTSKEQRCREYKLTASRKKLIVSFLFNSSYTFHAWTFGGWNYSKWVEE